jgi:acetyl esterase/lipase
VRAQATDVIPLWPDGPPTTIEGLPPEIEFPVDFGVAKGGTMIRNISEPTLSIFEPTGVSNGHGIIVAPGGGWTINAWTHEGLDVADWLTPLGFTVFLLKYRVQASHPDQAKFEKFWAAQDSSLLGPIPKANKPQAIGDVLATDAYVQARLAAADDGRRAIELVRARFAGTVGMLGFSAGAFLAVDIALDPRAEQLAYIAPIYGGETRGATVPADAPPLFTAVAQDDILVKIVEGVHGDWSGANRSSELHVFARGAHGFGMVKQGLPSDQWTQLFSAWLDDLGVARC